MKKYLSKITNGIVLILISLFHVQLAFSNDGFGNQFSKFANRYFFKISNGMDDLPALVGKTDFETFATFWFFYFGLLLIPIGLLAQSIEKDKKYLPLSFTLSYLVVIIIGSYMVPNSGMTFIMLPHAIFMLINSHSKKRKLEHKVEVKKG